jgi:tRNA (adenine57-N1/adenine58-N1)-methyltransferase
MAEKIHRGANVLLLGPRNYLVKCAGKFGCKYGEVNMDKLIGKQFGTKIKAGKSEFTAVQPTLRDYLFKKASRGPQVVLPKDSAAIMANTGCGKGWKVVDAGTGSGFLSMFLANAGCDVVTYEKRRDFFENARKNIKGSGLKVKTVNRDITKGIKERNVNLVTLDMQNPERAIPHAYRALTPGGWLAVFSMHTEQMKDVVKAVKRAGFLEPKIVEVLEREWQVQIYGKNSYSRPKTHMLGHTGFLTFCRKV